MLNGIKKWAARTASHYGNQTLDVAGALSSGALAFQQAAADEKGPAIGLGAVSAAFIWRMARREMGHVRPQA